MRFKRVLAMALCALLTLTVCMTLLPKTAHAAVTHIQIRGQTLTSATPYYKDGVISGPISDWQAYWDRTDNVLHLRNLNEITVQQGIVVMVTGASGDLLTIDLQGSNSIEMSTEDARKAIEAPCALIFTGNGSLSVKSSGARPGGASAYGIEANAIALTGNASLTVAGNGANGGATNVGIAPDDWSHYNATARENVTSAADAVAITQTEYEQFWKNYQYVRFQHIPVPGGSGADVPRTGDGANPLLWLGLALLSGAGLTVNIRRRKRG